MPSLHRSSRPTPLPPVRTSPLRPEWEDSEQRPPPVPPPPQLHPCELIYHYRCDSSPSCDVPPPIPPLPKPPSAGFITNLPTTNFSHYVDETVDTTNGVPPPVPPPPRPPPPGFLRELDFHSGIYPVIPATILDSTLASSNLSATGTLPRPSLPKRPPLPFKFSTCGPATFKSPSRPPLPKSYILNEKTPSRPPRPPMPQSPSNLPRPPPRTANDFLRRRPPPRPHSLNLELRPREASTPWFGDPSSYQYFSTWPQQPPQPPPRHRAVNPPRPLPRFPASKHF